MTAVPPGKRRCSYPTCYVIISADQIACRLHWYLAPKALRDAVWDAYANRRREPMPHLRAVGAVVRFYREHEERTAAADRIMTGGLE